jgi:hypothetical protein
VNPLNEKCSYSTFDPFQILCSYSTFDPFQIRFQILCSYSTFDPFQIRPLSNPAGKYKVPCAVLGEFTRAGDDAVIGQGGGIGRVETAAGRSEGDAAFCIEGEGGGGREDAAVERKVPGSSGARGGAESRILRCVCSRSAGSERSG